MAKTVLNAGKIIKRFKALGNNVEVPVQRALVEGAMLMHGDAVNNIQSGARSGAARRRGGNSSAAGEYPKTDTGQLVASLFFGKRGKNSAVMGTRLNYGKYLEFGTSKMDARPWLRPTFKAKEKEIKFLVSEAFKKEVKKNGR